MYLLILRFPFLIQMIECLGTIQHKGYYLAIPSSRPSFSMSQPKYASGFRERPFLYGEPCGIKVLKRPSCIFVPWSPMCPKVAHHQVAKALAKASIEGPMNYKRLTRSSRLRKSQKASSYHRCQEASYSPLLELIELLISLSSSSNYWSISILFYI